MTADPTQDYLRPSVQLIDGNVTLHPNLQNACNSAIDTGGCPLDQPGEVKPRNLATGKPG